jgi:hypothetical protein
LRAGDGGARQCRYEKLRELVSATAGNEADADAADEQLSVALEAGKAAVEIGWIDPEYAKAALTELLLSEAASTRTRHRFRICPAQTEEQRSEPD